MPVQSQREANLFLNIKVMIIYMIATRSSVIGQSTTGEANNKTVIELYPTYLEFANRFFPNFLLFDRYFTFLDYIVGFPGNLIAFFVWSNRRVFRGNSAAIYLAALSLNNIIVLILVLIDDLRRLWNVSFSESFASCVCSRLFTLSTQYTSPLFVLAYTIERWLAICKPFLIDRICRTKRAFGICLGIVVTTIATCSGVVKWTFVEDGICQYKSKTGDQQIYLLILECLYSLFIPVLALIFNLLVIREMTRVHRSNKRIARMVRHLSTDDHPTRQSQQEKAAELEPIGNNHLSIEETKTGETNGLECAGGGDDDERRNSRRNLLTQPPAVKEEQKSRMSAPVPPLRTFSRQASGDQSCQSGPNFRSTTFMLIAVSFYMIIATLLAGTTFLLIQQTAPNLNVTVSQLLVDPEFYNYKRRANFKRIADEISITYYAFGCVICYATGRNFRQNVHRLFQSIVGRCRSFKGNGIAGSSSYKSEYLSASRPRPRRHTTVSRLVSDVGAGGGEICAVNGPPPEIEGSPDKTQSPNT